MLSHIFLRGNILTVFETVLTAPKTLLAKFEIVLALFDDVLTMFETVLAMFETVLAMFETTLALREKAYIDLVLCHPVVDLSIVAFISATSVVNDFKTCSIWPTIASIRACSSLSSGGVDDDVASFLFLDGDGTLPEKTFGEGENGPGLVVELVLGDFAVSGSSSPSFKEPISSLHSKVPF